MTLHINYTIVYMYVLYFYVVGCICQPQINEHVMLCYAVHLVTLACIRGVINPLPLHIDVGLP